MFTCPDLPAGMAQNVNQGSFRGQPSPRDAVCCIKRYISDKELSQEPLLVLTQGRADGFNLLPTQKSLCTHGVRMHKEFEKQ